MTIPRKRIFRYWVYPINCLVWLLLLASCTEREEHMEDTTATTTRQIRLFAGSDTPLTQVNGYLFRNGIFYKKYGNLDLSADYSATFNVPAHSELYFLANLPEPDELAGMREGITTQKEFLAYHTPDTAAHSATRAPTAFYSARVKPDIAAASFDVLLGLNQSRIDLDASDASGVKVERIYTRTAARTTCYFPVDSLPSVTHHCEYSRTFETPEPGKVEDLFRIYESGSPVTFIIDAVYGDRPVAISTTIPQVKRNKKYTIRLQSDGMNVVGNIVTDEWKTGDEITANPSEGMYIRIDVDSSVLPADATIDAGRTSVEVSYKGTEGMKLAFSTNGPLELESVEGRTRSISDPEISSKDGKVLTSYKIALLPNASSLTSCVTLNLKNTPTEGPAVYGKITLNIRPFPYKIAETNIGGQTWMAFNTADSPELSEQIYPEAHGYNTPKDMIEKNWVASLGSLVRWTDARCPEGYRLPTRTELSSLLWGDAEGTTGGGSIPGEWECNGDPITAVIKGSGKVIVDSKNVVPRYLEIKKETGTTLYFPFAGMKDGLETTDNDAGDILCLWSGESAGMNTAYAYRITYTGEPILYPENNLILNKEAYASVRCVKAGY